MAAVMCAAAVTTSATTGGRARQLSRRVGARSRHPRRHARVTEAANAATLTAGTVAVDVPHIAGNYVTSARLLPRARRRLDAGMTRRRPSTRTAWFSPHASIHHLTTSTAGGADSAHAPLHSVKP